MSRLICLCKGVRENDIQKVTTNCVKPSLELVQEKTGAATNCGRCIMTIEALIEQQNTSREQE